MSSNSYSPRRKHDKRYYKPADKSYSKAGLYLASCTGCGKHVYKSRDDAKKAAVVNHPGVTMRAYQCLDSDATPAPWHYTHMSAARTAAWKDYEDELARNRSR